MTHLPPPGPVLTIITINKNNAEGLSRTIASVLPLLGARVHYLVMDGASEDGSADIAASLLAGRAEARLVCEPDRGIYDAMNKGWRQCTSEFVAFINSGDEVIPTAYERFVRVLEARAADIVYARVALASVGRGVQMVHERHPWQLNSDTLPHPGTAVRRQVFSKLDGFDERYKMAADRDFFIRAHQCGASFQFVPEAVAVFFLGGLSSTVRSRIESASVSRAHGYIGASGWLVRILWARLSTSFFLTDETVFRVRSWSAGLRARLWPLRSRSPRR